MSWISLRGLDTTGADATNDTPRFNPATGRLEYAPGGGSSSGGIQSVVAGTGIAVDNTDPANPVVSATGSGGGGGKISFVWSTSGAGLPNYVPSASVAVGDIGFLLMTNDGAALTGPGGWITLRNAINDNTSYYGCTTFISVKRVTSADVGATVSGGTTAHLNNTAWLAFYVRGVGVSLPSGVTGKGHSGTLNLPGALAVPSVAALALVFGTTLDAGTVPAYPSPYVGSTTVKNGYCAIGAALALQDAAPSSAAISGGTLDYSTHNVPLQAQ